MQLSLPLPVLFILHRLQTAGYEAYIVGGAVRDLLLNDVTQGEHIRQVVDYDFTTNAKPEEIQAVFPENFYENDFGTVSVTAEHLAQLMNIPLTTITPSVPDSAPTNKIIDAAQATKLHESLQPLNTSEVSSVQSLSFPDYQITTYRRGEVYDDFRRPSSVEWGQTLEEDLTRRDFSINALAIQVDSETLKAALATANLDFHQSLSVKVTIIDPFKGLRDLELHLVRAVGEASARYQEDALRMLRATRFAVQLNFQIEDQTFSAIIENSSLLKHISGERIRDEFMKMLASDYPAEGIELLDDAGLLTYIIPELLTAKGVEQAGHHTTDVWTHSLDALRHCPSSDPVVRLATLIHDIAKPMTQQVLPNTITFYNHEIIGARVAKKIGERLRLSRHDTQRLFILVRYHMFYYQPTHTDAAIRRFMRKVGLENIDDILALREGDRLGSGARSTSWRLEEMKQRMQAQLHQPMSIKDLAINGNDLMTELNLKPGPLIGQVLKDLFDQVFEQPDLNTREKLLPLAQESLTRLQRT